MKQKTASLPKALFWFRRDLRLSDNVALARALFDFDSVLPIFIFDTTILGHLEADDARVLFIYRAVESLREKVAERGSSLQVYHGDPREIFPKIFALYKPQALYLNHDYEPSALQRDVRIAKICGDFGVRFETSKDQVVFEKSEILSNSESVYTVFTPYKKKWLATLQPEHFREHRLNLKNLWREKSRPLPPLVSYGFTRTEFPYFPSIRISAKVIRTYEETRDIPSIRGTTHVGPHLRFGTLSVRELVRKYRDLNSTYLSELIWREFFMQILFHFPHVVKNSFRPKYDHIAWRTSKAEFERWAAGQTGYPLVDAGMREMNETGFMHNRVRMVTASFLCKHLLHYWYEGERYMAARLLDYDLSANNGNWQWAAGSGCDAAPYFRIFRPDAQAKRFDPQFAYIKKWVPEWGTAAYPEPMIDHARARERALEIYRKGLK